MPSDKEFIWMSLIEARNNADAKWGKLSMRSHDKNKRVTILLEEVGEVARAVLEGDDHRAGKELIDVMQVCMAWLETDLAELDIWS